jgi:hypothetical protein
MAEDSLNEQNAKQEMNSILIELRQKMSEIDAITKELEEKRKVNSAESPKRTKKLLEEIKVPPLELLK